MYVGTDQGRYESDFFVKMLGSSKSGRIVQHFDKKSRYQINLIVNLSNVGSIKVLLIYQSIIIIRVTGPYLRGGGVPRRISWHLFFGHTIYVAQNYGFGGTAPVFQG